MQNYENLCKRNLLNKKNTHVEGIKLVDEIKTLGVIFDGFNGFES